MLYPEIPKSKIKGTYIAGGIFLLLFGIPVLLLFMQPFFQEFNIILWDWNLLGLGINSEFINSVLHWVAYLVLPWILVFVNIAGMFTGISKSSLFVKGASLCFFLSFVLKYGLWIINIDASTIQMLGYLAMGLAGIGALLLITGFALRFTSSERQNENKASGFLMFTSTFWLIVALVDIIGGFVGLGANILKWILPIALGIYGLIGGILMILTCKRKTETKLTEKDIRINAEINGAKIKETKQKKQAEPFVQNIPQNDIKPNVEVVKPVAQAGQPAQPVAQTPSQPVQPPVQPTSHTPVQPAMPPRPPIPPQGARPPMPRPPMPQGVQGARPPMPPRPPMPQGTRPPIPPQGVPPRMPPKIPPNFPPRMPPRPPMPPKNQGEN